jgi:hypothetical protein
MELSGMHCNLKLSLGNNDGPVIFIGREHQVNDQ